MYPAQTLFSEEFITVAESNWGRKSGPVGEAGTGLPTGKNLQRGWKTLQKWAKAD
jgi:hypothetical protein